MQIQVQDLINFNIQVCSISLLLLKKYGIRYIAQLCNNHGVEVVRLTFFVGRCMCILQITKYI